MRSIILRGFSCFSKKIPIKMKLIIEVFLSNISSSFSKRLLFGLHTIQTIDVDAVPIVSVCFYGVRKGEMKHLV